VRYPAGLGTDGRALWRELAETYVFDSPHERSSAVEACRLADEIATLRAQLGADGRAFVRGSQGQDVANPLYAEIRAHAALRHKLLSSIGVETEAVDRSAMARKMARARWEKAS
jgi:hypothetical protein